MNRAFEAGVYIMFIELCVLAFFFFVGLITLLRFFIKFRQVKSSEQDLKNPTMITPSFFRSYFFFLSTPFVKIFEILGLKPSHITWLSLVLASVGAGFMAYAEVFWAGWCLAFSGLFDTVDGKLARKNKTMTLSGAFLDSIFDRYSVYLFFSGIIIGNMYGRFNRLFTYFALASIVASAMTSYAKERGANLGVSDGKGLMQRGDRLLVLCVVTIYDPLFAWMSGLLEIDMEHLLLLSGLFLVGFVGNLSASRRIIRIYRALKKI